jgi:two-component system, cell cycle sensor histidine kinase and response regulator CckA
MAIDLPSPAELDRLRLVAIVASADDAIVSKDLDGTVRTWNPAAERIFGYPPEEMVGGSIFKLIPPELHDEERGLLARIRRGEHIAHYETDRVRKDGRRIRVSLTLSPLRDAAGQLIGASAIKRDVTAQRALEARLQSAQRMEAVGRLAGGVAHDFNNLLTVMGGMAALALKEAPDGSALRRSLTHIIDAAERAGALTRELLTYGRRQIAELEVLQLNDVIRKLQALLHPLFGEHITVRTLLADDLGLLRANMVQLEQVVMNLALNARDAMPDGGTITIRTENVFLDDEEATTRLRLAPGRYVKLVVCDTGDGMDAVTRANIFEPFFTTKQIGYGTGLGLSTVYAIVQEAGGAIDVRSEPGQGSEFTVYLPQVAAPEDAPAALAPEVAAPAEDPPHRGTILLVEDEPVVRGFTSEVLQAAGYHVLQAGSGEESLAVAADSGRTIDVLLTDVVLPGMNGRMLAEQLLANHRETKVLYMSGYTDDMVVRTGVVTRSAAFLPKPFTPQGLLARVQALLSESRPSGGIPRLS